LFWDASYQRQYVAIAYPTFTLPDLEVVKLIIQEKSASHDGNREEDDAIGENVNVVAHSVSSSSSSVGVLLRDDNVTDTSSCNYNHYDRHVDQILCDDMDAFKNTKDSKLCFEFAKSGTCKHGDKCKFMH